MLLTGNRKKISLLLKLIVIFSAFIGTFLSYIAGRRSFMGGSRVFILLLVVGFCYLKVLDRLDKRFNKK